MVSNPEAEAFFTTRHARDEVGTAVIESLKRLGEYELRGDLRIYRAPYAVTRNIVFCGAAGTSSTYWRLRPGDVKIALESGARPTDIGSEWVCFELFRLDYPKPDLAHWALRAYDFARTGA